MSWWEHKTEEIDHLVGTRRERKRQEERDTPLSPSDLISFY
jgi:hypothetical protein